jgi:hypothetical protein
MTFSGLRSPAKFSTTPTLPFLPLNCNLLHIEFFTRDAATPNLLISQM